MKNKVTDSIINEVAVKSWNESKNAYDYIITANDIVFSDFIAYVDDLSANADVHWSADFLNPDHTLATVYVTH